MIPDLNTYAVYGRERDLIIVKENGSSISRTVDPAIMRRMPDTRQKAPLHVRLKHLMENFSNCLTTQDLS